MTESDTAGRAAQHGSPRQPSRAPLVKAGQEGLSPLCQPPLAKGIHMKGAGFAPGSSGPHPRGWQDVTAVSTPGSQTCQPPSQPRATSKAQVQSLAPPWAAGEAPLPPTWSPTQKTTGFLWDHPWTQPLLCSQTLTPHLKFLGCLFKSGCGLSCFPLSLVPIGAGHSPVQPT